MVSDVILWNMSPEYRVNQLFKLHESFEVSEALR